MRPRKGSVSWTRFHSEHQARCTYALARYCQFLKYQMPYCQESAISDNSSRCKWTPNQMAEGKLLMESLYVLHSPLVGPLTWSPVADELGR